MKRLISILMAAAMLLCMCACSGSAPADQPQEEETPPAPTITGTYTANIDVSTRIIEEFCASLNGLELDENTMLVLSIAAKKVMLKATFVFADDGTMSITYDTEGFKNSLKEFAGTITPSLAENLGPVLYETLPGYSSLFSSLIDFDNPKVKEFIEKAVDTLVSAAIEKVGAELDEKYLAAAGQMPAYYELTDTTVCFKASAGSSDYADNFTYEKKSGGSRLILTPADDDLREVWTDCCFEFPLTLIAAEA